MACRGASGHVTASRALMLPHPSHCCCGCGRSSVSTEPGFPRLITGTDHRHRPAAPTTGTDHRHRPAAPTSAMSSLLRPFSVGEAPCESCGGRRRGPSSAARQQPSPRRLAAAAPAGPDGLPAHQLSYTAKRNLAAAAVGGRKITHPGKAILAGGLLLPIVCRCADQPPVCASNIGQSLPAGMLHHTHDVAAPAPLCSHRLKQIQNQQHVATNV